MDHRGLVTTADRMPVALDRRVVAVALPLALGLVALALRLHGLGDKPFWVDELLTVRRAALPFGQLVADALHNRHYPGYFLLVHAFAPAGGGEWALRLPSAVIGAAAVAIVALIAHDLAGARASLAAGLLLAFSPFQVQYSQEARSYALVSCLVLIALWGALRLVRDPAAAARRPMQADAPRGAWTAYVLGTAAALNVLNIAVPWLVAANLVMLALLLRAPDARRGLLRNWLLAQAIILVAWLPAVIAMYLASRGTILGGFDWAPPINGATLWSTVAAAYLFRISDVVTLDLLPAALPGFGLAIAVLALIGLWRARIGPAALVLVGLAAIAPAAALLLASFVHPMVVTRYLMWSTGPFYLLAGLGVAALPARWFAPLAAAMLAACIACLAPYYGAETKPRWDLAAAYLAGRVEPGDTVVTNSDWAQYMLESYYRRFHFDADAWPIARNPGEIAVRPPADGRVWVVYGRVGQGAMEPIGSFLGKLSALGQPVLTTALGQHIVAVLYDPAVSLRRGRNDANRAAGPSAGVPGSGPGSRLR